MDIKTLVKITSRAWSLNILALMHNGVAGRQASLLAATNASRTAFAQSLDHLIGLELIEKNPGHGHPLRPEYRLTILGKEIAQTASNIMGMANKNPQNQMVLRRSWTIPIIAVSQKPRYFIDIKQQLETITDRALSQSIKNLEQCTWLSRHIDIATRPPRPQYQATNLGADISQIINLT